MARPCLLDRLRTDAVPVVLVSGPAGAGKTALVEEWARGERDVRILRLTRHHNAADALLAAILDALGVPADGIDVAAVHTWSRALGTGPSVLVLDGAEAITDPDSQDLLRDLVEHCPARLRLIVTTRHRNPAWLTRCRARGGAATITADDLRIRPDEVEAAARGDLDGWALGTGLVAALGPAGADEPIRDFLRTEVTDRVTTEVRRLLYAVSVPGAADPALAIHLAGNPAAGHLLARFAETTQFATVTDGPVFTLHPVLTRHLRAELATEHWEYSVALHRRYADRLADEGRLDLSTSTYVELGEVATACSTLLAHWEQPVLSGRPEIVRAALGHLPPQRLAGDPRSSVVTAMVHLAAGDLRTWRRWVDVAEVHDDVEMEPGLAVGTACAVARRFVDAVTSGTAPPAAAGVPLRGLWSAIGAVADGLVRMWAGDLQAATTCFHRAEAAARVAGDQLALVHALAGLALSAALGGDDAGPLADEAIAVADRLSPPCRWVVANAHLALAEVRAAAGDVQGAASPADDALAALREFPPQLEQRTRARAADLAGAGRAGRDRPAARDLSGREHRVLRALCGPLTLREIADELFVSHNTVKSQVRSIFRKLDVHDRAAAVTAARSRALTR